MKQIKIFEGSSQSNSEDINGWLRENLNIQLLDISHNHMFDYYSEQEPRICNQWIMTTVIYKEEEE